MWHSDYFYIHLHYSQTNKLCAISTMLANICSKICEMNNLIVDGNQQFLFFYKIGGGGLTDLDLLRSISVYFPLHQEEGGAAPLQSPQAGALPLQLLPGAPVTLLSLVGTGTCAAWGSGGWTFGAVSRMSSRSFSPKSSSSSSEMIIVSYLGTLLNRNIVLVTVSPPLAVVTMVPFLSCTHLGLGTNGVYSFPGLLSRFTRM